MGSTEVSLWPQSTLQSALQNAPILPGRQDRSNVVFADRNYAVIPQSLG